MTAREMQINFDMYIQQANKLFSVDLKPDSYTIFEFINQAQESLTKTRYSGNNNKGTGFEQDQKRTDDLRELVVEVTLPVVAGTYKPNSFVATLPADYFVTVGEEVILDISGSTLRTHVAECTSDTYGPSIEDPYSEHLLHYGEAKPLRLYIQDEVELITDGNYDVTDYILRYLKNPPIIDLDGNDCELPIHMHREIVLKAVNLFLASVKDEGYQLSKIELQELE